MTAKKLVSIVVAIGSVVLGGATGSSALKQANAAPLARSASLADSSVISGVSTVEPSRTR